MPKATYKKEVRAEKTGYVESLDAEKCGNISLKLGAGRIKKEDGIDHLAGIVLEKKIGNKVNKGDTLAYIYTNKEEEIENAVEELQKAYKLTEKAPEEYKHILQII